MRTAGDKEKDPTRGSAGAALLVNDGIAENTREPNELPRWCEP